jgi:hypothetical protein
MKKETLSELRDIMYRTPNVVLKKAEGAFMDEATKKVTRGKIKDVILPRPTPDSDITFDSLEGVKRKDVKFLLADKKKRLNAFKNTLRYCLKNPKKYLEGNARKDSSTPERCENANTKKCCKEVTKGLSSTFSHIYHCDICENIKLKDLAKAITRLKKSVKLNQLALKSDEIVTI